MAKWVAVGFLDLCTSIAANLIAACIEQSAWSQFYTPWRLAATFVATACTLAAISCLESGRCLRASRRWHGFWHARGVSPAPQFVHQRFISITKNHRDQAAAEMELLGSLDRREVDEVLEALDRDRAVLLIGEGGSGKSGIVFKLTECMLAHGHPVLLLSARDYPRNATVAEIEHVLTSGLPIPDGLEIVSRRAGACTLIVDQLDWAGGADLGRWLCTLMEEASARQNVMVLGVSRTWDAGLREEIRSLPFSRVESKALSAEQASDLLVQLGIPAPPPALAELGRNLLNLSLVAELVNANVDVSHVSGLLELWEMYRVEIQRREGPEALGQALTIARETLQAERRVFCLPIAPGDATARLLGRGVLVKSWGERYAFRHESIQDYLYGWDAALRQRLLPGQVLRQLPEHVASGVLRWMHLLYHKHDSEVEAEFVRELLQPSQDIGFYTRMVALDTLKEQSDPTPSLAEVLADALREPSLARYFFRDLDNPAWLAPLKDAGLFDSPPPPIETEEGGYRIPAWDASEYLIRVADAHPDLVVEITLKVETENFRVHQDLLQAAVRMAAEEAAEIVPAVIQWLHGGSVSLVPKYAGELMVYLAQGQQLDAALELLRDLTEPIVQPPPEDQEVPGWLRPATAQPRIERYALERTLQKQVPRLADICWVRVLPILEAQLVKAVELEREAEQLERAGDLSRIWRSAVEDHPQNSSTGDMKDLLIAAIRDTLVGAATEAGARESIERYLQHEYSIFRRLAIHVIRLNPEYYLDLVTRLLSSRANLSDPDIHHEFYLLMESEFDSTPSDVQRRLLEWIMEGEPPEQLERSKEYYQDRVGDEPPQDLVEKWKEHWTLSRLWALRSFDLPGDYRSELDRLRAEFGDPEHPSFLAYRTSHVGPTSPESKAELGQMARSDLIKHLTEDLPYDEPFKPSHEGRARLLREVVRDSPQEYASLIPSLWEAGVKPVYLEYLLLGLEEACKDGAEFEWGPVLALCEVLVEEGDFDAGEQPYVRFLDSYNAVYRQVTSLLQQGLRGKDHGVPAEYMPRVQDFLLTLQHHPEPSPSEQEQFGLDHATLSINTVRGIALRTLVLYALRRLRMREAGHVPESPTPVETGLEIELRSALTCKLDKSIEPSPGVHSVFGELLPILHYLDRAWVTDHLPEIFPGEERMDEYWRAAWNSYISFNQPYNDVYHLLRDQYRRAAAELTTVPESSHPWARTGESLADHLMVAYWRGLEELGDANGLLTLFYLNASDDVRAHAVWYLWRAIEDVKPTSDSEVWQRLRTLWESRVATVAQASDSSGYRQELSAFGWWLSVAPEELDTLCPLIKAIIPYLDERHQTANVVEYLASHAHAHPALAAELLLQLIQREQWSVFRGQEETRTTLTEAMHSGDPRAREFAEGAINLLGEERGDYSYRDLLE